jgi:REP element-mobilizing transposase RayT
MTTLKAPFPYFGSKRAVASVVWERLGDCPNYVEPFFGSGAVLLGRPHWPFSGTLWSRAYYVGACGHASESVVRMYVENQKTK